jgi:hypothetical protein
MLESDIPLVMQVIRDKANKPVTVTTVRSVKSNDVISDPRLTGKNVEAVDVSRVRTALIKQLQEEADPWVKLKHSKHLYPLGTFPEWSWEYWLNYFYTEASELVRKDVFDELHKGGGVLKKGAEVPATTKKSLLKKCLADGFDQFPVSDKLTPEEMFETTQMTDAGARGFRVLFRGDARPATQIRDNKGTLPQSRVKSLHASRGMDPDWHPFAREKYGNKVYFRRGGHNKDNCLFTAISLATDFQTATKFPLLDELISTQPTSVGTATVIVKDLESHAVTKEPAKVQVGGSVDYRTPDFGQQRTNTMAKRFEELARKSTESSSSGPFQSTGIVARGKVRDAINRHASEISRAGGDKSAGELKVLKASRSNIYVVKAVGGWNTEARQTAVGATEFPERAKKDKRSNGCFPRTEGAVEPYRGEERVRVRSEPGATLSLKPLDDRLGEAAMLNAAICATFGPIFPQRFVTC